MRAKLPLIDVVNARGFFTPTPLDFRQDLQRRVHNAPGTPLAEATAAADPFTSPSALKTSLQPPVEGGSKERIGKDFPDYALCVSRAFGHARPAQGGLCDLDAGQPRAGTVVGPRPSWKL